MVDSNFKPQNKTVHNLPSTITRNTTKKKKKTNLINKIKFNMQYYFNKLFMDKVKIDTRQQLQQQ